MTVEFAARLPLSRNELDRDAEFRTTPDLDRVLRDDPATRWLPVHRGELLRETDGALRFVRAEAVPEDAVTLYLGRAVVDAPDAPAGTRFVAVLVDDRTATAIEPDDDAWVSLRMFGTELSARDQGLAVEAVAMANWHAVHGFSPRTGSATEVVTGGWVRRDPEGHEHFPRTDAAIIVGVTDADDRILLGSNAAWDADRYSLLAGFVEPGESLEDAVRREVWEESGVRVEEPEYLGSQPWPFPASLMVGFRARAVDGDPSTARPDGVEILDVRWFSRDDVRERAGDTLLLPGRTSIARAIIEEWYGEPLDLP
ncbi:NAD(+) diphosphatase [Curtobacterium sp. Csp1]|uniref:NAD(+) diphosphatase n=1 Tax=Curtobacterium citreum TaxID=2036 RepID=A0ABT2HFC1_9MICO|nr:MULTISPECIES: NAD(+) diphosphatase [Curtobacterium]MCS6521857.1 NAD(+) diphosphatase [Curtobacterium citreum]QKS12180.1 NAD(+) diphosphatase [Curtobacterium sp. csp3]QKS19763.1 NAD(+) diphosphatase [Curtobacterium sp. Csp1]TQJ27248.1 NAD+ diphosphatase [Curtobacterium citreum]GGL72861.1 NTP pyrophosphohydrolase [Curtobacterium citreum]